MKCLVQQYQLVKILAREMHLFTTLYRDNRTLWVDLLNKQKNQIKSIKNMNKPPKRLLDQVREQIRLRHYSIRTEQAYT